MDVQKLTEKSQQALAAANGIAVRRNHQGVDAEHLLAALLEDREGLAPTLLARAGAQQEALRVAAATALDKIVSVSGPGRDASQAYLTKRLADLLARAEDEAQGLKDEYISVEHLLLAMLEDHGATGEALREAGVARPALLAALRDVRGNQRVTNQNPEATYESLEKFGRDLTQAAESGKLDTESTYKALSSGLAGMGALYLLAKGGAIFIDPSFPVHYGIVRQVFPLQAAAATAMSLTLRPDTK